MQTVSSSNPREQISGSELDWVVEDCCSDRVRDATPSAAEFEQRSSLQGRILTHSPAGTKHGGALAWAYQCFALINSEPLEHPGRGDYVGGRARIATADLRSPGGRRMPRAHDCVGIFLDSAPFAISPGSHGAALEPTAAGK